jgi:hypothetical protein
MADIVNLRQARKDRARAERERLAAANRALHGRSKAEKALEKDGRERRRAFLDGHRRDRPDDGEA